jgi:hypothetical protein
MRVVFVVSVPAQEFIKQCAFELANEDPNYRPSNIFVKKFSKNNVMLIRKANKSKLKRVRPKRPASTKRYIKRPKITRKKKRRGK